MTLPFGELRKPSNSAYGHKKLKATFARGLSMILLRMIAPQVGLEPTTLRLAAENVSGYASHALTPLARFIASARLSEQSLPRILALDPSPD